MAKNDSAAGGASSCSGHPRESGDPARASVLDDERVSTALMEAGYGFLMLSPVGGATYSDDRIERLMVRLAESLKAIGEDEGASYCDLACASLEFCARMVTTPFNMKRGKRQELRKLADDMAKNLKGRILDSVRNLGPGQGETEN
jgi:hypothetical protein